VKTYLKVKDEGKLVPFVIKMMPRSAVSHLPLAVPGYSKRAAAKVQEVLISES